MSSAVASKTNGNGSVLKWMLGIVTVIIGGVGTLALVWLVGSTFHNTSEIALMKARMYGIEKVNTEQEVELRNIKRILQDRKTQ